MVCCTYQRNIIGRMLTNIRDDRTRLSTCSTHTHCFTVKHYFTSLRWLFLSKQSTQHMAQSLRPFSLFLHRCTVSNSIAYKVLTPTVYIDKRYRSIVLSNTRSELISNGSHSYLLLILDVACFVSRISLAISQTFFIQMYAPPKELCSRLAWNYPNFNFFLPPKHLNRDQLILICCYPTAGLLGLSICFDEQLLGVEDMLVFV